MALRPDDLAAAIQEQLTLYGQEVLQKLDVTTKSAMDSIVAKTKATAPVGKRHGKFKRAISSKKLDGNYKTACKYVWFVRAPEYRLTHLLVNGHATRNGGRTDPNSFLANALAEVIPAYEKEIAEVVKR